MIFKDDNQLILDFLFITIYKAPFFINTFVFKQNYQDIDFKKNILHQFLMEQIPLNKNLRFYNICLVIL